MEMQRVESGRCSGIVPFLSVIGFTASVITVPILLLAVFFLIVIISFWPLLILVVPLLIAGATTTIVSLVALFWIFPKRFARVVDWFQVWMVFLLPFHGIFGMLLCLVFSFYWGLALGACLFLHGEVLWDREQPIQRKSWFVAAMERVVAPVFQYFPIRIKRCCSWDDDSVGSHDTDQRMRLFAFHPHGVYAFGLFSLVFQRASGYARLFPRRGILVGVASALLHVPVAQYFFSFLGFVPASRSCLDLACQSQFDVAIIPGGIAEMILPADEGAEVLYIRKRRGFIRLAVRHGRDLVPVFSFGESRTFTRVSACQRLREEISRRCRVSLQLFYGRWFTLVPYAEPITVVVGRPIRVSDLWQRKDANQDEATFVEEVHARYVRELTQLYEQNKHLHPGYKNRELKLL